jgi:guanyl-specific ribonuclease Sa
MIFPTRRDELPFDVKNALREMLDHLKRGTVYPRLGFRVYANEGGHGSTRLPPARKKQTYYEGQVGATQNDERGSYRLVLLIDDSNERMLKGYYTRDHYQTFYEFS